MLTFAALGDETRSRIVEALAERDRSVTEIVDLFTISQPAVSRHLRILREAGLVTVSKDAQRRVYRLDPTGLQAMADWVVKAQHTMERRLDRLGAHLDDMAAARGRKDRSWPPRPARWPSS